MPRVTQRQLSKAADKLAELQLQQQELKEQFLAEKNPGKKEVFKKKLIDIHKKVTAAEEEFERTLEATKYMKAPKGLGLEDEFDMEDDFNESKKFQQNEQRLREIIRKKIHEKYNSFVSDEPKDRFEMKDFLVEALGESETLKQITHAMSNKEFYDIYEYIVRMNNLI